MDNTTNAILIIVKRDKRIAVPSFTEDLGTVERVSVENTVYLFARSDAVCIVGVFDVIELFKLASLFPSQRMSKVRRRVALRVVFNGFAIKVGEKILPNCITVSASFTISCYVNYTPFLLKMSIERTILPSPSQI